MATDTAVPKPRYDPGAPYWLLPLAASWTYAVWLYTQLPAVVPVHWNFAGQIDRYGGRVEAALLMPAMLTLVAILLVFPCRRRNVRLLSLVIMSFLFAVQLVTGYSFLTGRLPLLITGAPWQWSVVLAALSWAYAAWLYTRLPAVVPIHWGLHGEPDGFAGRVGGAFLLPAIFTVLEVAIFVASRQAPLLLVGIFLLGMQVAVSVLQIRYRPQA